MQKTMRFRNFTRVAMYFAVSMAGVAVVCATEMAAAADPGEMTMKSMCVPCHRIEGKPAPRKAKNARISSGPATNINRIGWSRGSRIQSSDTIPSATIFVPNGKSRISDCPSIRRGRSRNSLPHGKIRVSRRE